MPQVVEQTPSTLERSFKAREVEGLLDLYFYRRIGHLLARFFARLGVTPNGVTILGGFFGIAAGHLYFYHNLPLNLVGLGLHVFANTLDNADGQLARLLNQQSRSGRIVDSLFDHLIFLSIYVHLGLRCLFGGAGWMLIFLVIAAGISHALQGAAADYFRNAYFYFVRGRARADWDSAANLRQEFGGLKWRTDAWDKFLVAAYMNFTWQQELLSPRLKRLRAEAEHSPSIPGSLRQQYQALAQPMFRWWGLLMTNTRMVFLAVCLVIDRPAWFFWLELSAMNFLLLWLLMNQESMAAKFRANLQRQSMD